MFIQSYLDFDNILKTVAQKSLWNIFLDVSLKQ